MADREPVGDFYAHVINSPSDVDNGLTSSTKLLSGQPTVIHFYNGGWGGCRPCAAQMEAWARSIPEARFLCVCVESLEVAIAFHKMFGFRDAVNAFIPAQQYFPVGYGQLGCSGFIVSDDQGRFVSRKTRAFLDYDQAAFRHVESILAKLVVPKDDDDDDAVVSSKRRKGDSKNSEEKKSEDSTQTRDLKEKIKPPPSVGVDVMDDEHKECTDCFNNVIENPSADNLKRLYDVLKLHFDHEEKLMKKYCATNQPTSSFSALDSHRSDHERILNIAREELDRVSGCGVLKGNWHKEPASLEAVRELTDAFHAHAELTDAFHAHAERFDSLYHDKIPAAAE